MGSIVVRGGKEKSLRSLLFVSFQIRVLWTLFRHAARTTAVLKNVSLRGEEFDRGGEGDMSDLPF